MARFSSIIYGCIFLVAAMAAADAQATNPVPMNGPVPNANQRMQPNARRAIQQTTPQQMNQQPQGSPAPNASQQPGQQQPGQQQPGQQQAGQQQAGQQQPAARPADPPPTTAPSPPVVTYRDGLLTVQAINSTLNSVVAAIRSKTGIEFEGWDNAAPDRVAISQGPAPAGEVLSAIFAGSKFDFVAIGRPDSPGIVQRVILSPKKGSGIVAAAQQLPQKNAGQEGDDDDTPDEQVNAVDPQDTAAQPPQVPQAQAPPENQQPSQPKTPDQLLQELQEMQKQQQQQQQGNPNPGQAPRKPQPPL
jgi:hypothetical protein